LKGAVMNKYEYLQKLDKLELDKTRYCIISGGAMIMYGLREKTNDIEEAIECMKRAILYDLNNSEYYDRMSDLYKEKEDYKTALEYMSEAANIDNSEEYKQKYAQLVKLNRKSK
jgi:tetratricopeptide (TPR) repeat protein